jgi:hypothetical protein
MRIMPTLLLPVLLAISPPSFASSSIEKASTCLTDSTSGRDRKDLVKWIYLAMSKHPEIRSHSSASARDDDESNRRVGELFTRLIADDCPAEINAMVSEHGIKSISLAFEVLGRVAMQELMAHPDVQSVFAGLDAHSDQSRIAPVLQAK